MHVLLTRSFRCVRSRSIQPMSTRFTISRSIGVLPTRSPMPSIVPCTRVAPASSAARLLMVPMSRSRCPCQSMPMSAPLASTRRLTNRDDGTGAGGRRVTNGVGDAQTRCAGIDRRLKQPPQRLGIGARRILGDVHHLQAMADAESDRLLGAALQIVHRPVFRVDADRARADEAAALDRQTGLLHDVGNRLNVGDERCARRSWPAREGGIRGSRTPSRCDVANDMRARRRATRCRPCRCRYGRAGAGCAASARWSVRAPTATAVRRAAFRRAAGPGQAAAPERRDSSRRSEHHPRHVHLLGTSCSSNYRGRHSRRIEPQVTHARLPRQEIPGGGQQRKDDEDRDDHERQTRAASMLEERSARWRRDARLGRRLTAAIADERLVSDFESGNTCTSCAALGSRASTLGLGSMFVVRIATGNVPRRQRSKPEDRRPRSTAQ